PEVVEDGIQGKLVGVGEVCSAAKAINDILASKEIWHAYSQSARDRIVEKFRLELITQEYENLYARVLKQDPVKPCDPDPILAELMESAGK
ncbi:MAG: hypothetical protein KC964_19185, partial [Candidatus Omnitrophica bacterium]|nr:hypothetical protein [Candidatus Omnitrophota bacterium]